LDLPTMTHLQHYPSIPATLRLAAVPDAAGEARSFVRSVLSEHPRINDALLSVSELVTNAVRHGPAGDGLEIMIDRHESAIRVSVHQRAGSFRIDRSHRTGVGGLGLMIVEKVSDAWGIDNQTGAWFELKD
jgi:anti-sigma regulatory factor (Ser/Thr protein kinase)